METFLSLPCPNPEKSLLENITDIPSLDNATPDLYNLTVPESALIDDMLSCNLSVFKDTTESRAYQKTIRNNSDQNSLNQYCDWFIRVLKATFGKDKAISATIFEEKALHPEKNIEPTYLSMRLIAIHLESPSSSELETEYFDNDDLASELSKLQNLAENKTQDNAIIFRRVIRIFDVVEKNGHKIPTIFIAKPDEVRYWTRSMAMRDADEIALDIMMWQQTRQEERTHEKTLY